MNSSLHRDQCCICDGTLSDVYTIKQFPLYMGANRSAVVEFEDMIYSTCNDCNTLQMRNLISPEILYKCNHNTDIVGNMWKNHYKQFTRFIFNNIAAPQTVLEIGDPACKMANENIHRNFERWTIIEPYDVANKFPRVVHIKMAIDKKFCVPLDPVDIIIMSHSFEHLLEPRIVIYKLHEVLKDNGYMFLSLPNMLKLAEHRQFPFHGLSFEHTFFCHPEVIKRIVEGKFIIEGIEYYTDHSVFYKLKKVKSSDGSHSEIVSVVNDFYNKMFHLNITQALNYVNATNESLKSTDSYYVFGAHVSTQFLLYLGINKEKIKCILDNSKAKIGGLLYGTPYLIESPSVLSEGTPTVLCNVGAFTDEIKTSLLDINDKIVFV